MKNYISLLLFLCIPFAWSGASANTRIVMDSDSGDYIGGGNSYDFTGPFTVSINDRSINISNTDGWRFEFVAPNDRMLEKGAYIDAERAPFRGPLNPGLSVSSPGRGCNTIAGEFYIQEITVDNTSPKLALDFVQRCEAGTTALNGSIRIDSTVAQPFTNPIAVNRTPSLIYEGDMAELDASGSFSGGAAIIAYQWAQLSGPAVSIANANADQTTLQVSDAVNLGGEAITLSLTVTDANSLVDTVQFSIEVGSKSDPRSYFTMDSEAGDYIGQGRTWSYDSGDSVISARRNFDNGVSVTIDSGDYWSTDFAAADDVQLETGFYDSATRFPFQDSGVPGLDISGDGRGCNNQYGKFTVEQLIWDGEDPVSFKALFEQRCESPTAPLLTGEVAFNAYHASVPTADAGVDFTVAEGQVANLNGSDSFDAVGTSLQYTWSTTTPSIEINNADQSRANFTAPPLNDRENSREIEVELYLVDDEGYASRDTVMVKVTANNSDPKAVDDSVNITVGDILTLEPLANDSDEDGELLTDSIDISVAPTYGSAVINSDGTVQYSHTSGNTETDSFAYSVKDNDGAISNVATVTILVTAETTDGDTTDGDTTDGDTSDGDTTDGDTTDGDTTDGDTTDGDTTDGSITDSINSIRAGSGSLETVSLLVLGILVMSFWRRRSLSRAI